VSKSAKKGQPKADPPTISQVIRDAIKRRGLTAYAVAKQTGVSVDPIQRFLNGERGLRLSTVERIASVLGLLLIDGQESKNDD
jgi:transcriptional regulator with XRE-family HTH domain